jgi:hypothetical protein
MPMEGAHWLQLLWSSSICSMLLWLPIHSAKSHGERHWLHAADQYMCCSQARVRG